jgi:hypothetical protein
MASAPPGPWVEKRSARVENPEMSAKSSAPSNFSVEAWCADAGSRCSRSSNSVGT